MGLLAQAESAYRTAISLDSNEAEPLNNLGNLLIEMGRAEEAIYLLKAALKLQPEYGDAHINLGIAYRKIGAPKRALQSFQVAVGLNIRDARLQNNLGVTLQMLGSNEEAMIAFAMASKINPDNMEANENLAALLTVLTPSESIRGPIVTAHSDVRAAHSLATSNESSIKSAVQYIKDMMACFPAEHPQFRTSLSQIYRRSDRDLNCGRHKSVFDKHGVIPEFCFGCYKLQIEPRNVIDLVKLFLFFEEIDLQNTRKCFVELRPEINGFYKGLIYCDNVDEADEVEEKLLPKLRERVAGYLALDLKRGCSEYPLRYPDYAHINRSGPQLMNYRNEWKDVEAKHDDTYLNLRPKLIMPTLRGASLQDASVIRKWFDYAKGLDDISHEALGFREILYPEVYEVGKRRRTQFSAFIEKPADQKAKGRIVQCH